MTDDPVTVVHAVLLALQSKFRGPDPIEEDDHVTVRCPGKTIRLPVAAALEMAIKETRRVYSLH